MANEKRLIDANALLENSDVFTMHTKEYGSIEVISVDAVGDAPTVDAVEVVHGHNMYDHDSAFECSVCGFSDWDTMTSDNGKYNYCPNCGASIRDGDGNG